MYKGIKSTDIKKTINRVANGRYEYEFSSPVESFAIRNIIPGNFYFLNTKEYRVVNFLVLKISRIFNDLIIYINYF